MKLVLIAGSPRPRSQSSRVSAFLTRRVASLTPGCTLTVLDLSELPLPAWNGDFAVHPFRDPASTWMTDVSPALDAAEGLIAVVPEHHGMVPPAFMNVLLTCRNELAHKPGLIVGLSATDGGSYPTVQLRGSATKNNRLCWIPEQVVIRSVKQQLLEENVAPSDRLVQRIDYALGLLFAYVEGLRHVRASARIDHDTFQFGQ